MHMCITDLDSGKGMPHVVSPMFSNLSTEPTEHTPVKYKYKYKIVVSRTYISKRPTAVKFKLGLYQLDIFNIPSWVSFGHFYASFHKFLSGMPYILRKKCFATKSRTCCLYFFEINRKRATDNSVMFILLYWYCHRGFGCGKMITFTLSVTFTHVTGPSHFVNTIIVSHNYRTQVLGSIPFTPSVVIKWHDRHRYLSIHHVPYL